MFNKFALEKLNENEKRIYNFLLSANLEKLSVRDVANKTFASPASVIRMTKKLGYSGYSEFIFELKKYAELKGERFQISLKQEGFFLIRDPLEIDIFLEALYKEKILIYAEGFSEIISSYMYKKLVVLGRDVTLFHGVDYEVVTRNPFKINPYSAVIIISKSGETPYCISFGEYMKEKGAKLITFTGNSQSTLSKISDVAFNYEDPYKEDGDIFYPNPFFGYVIVGFEELIKLYFEKYI